MNCTCSCWNMFIWIQLIFRSNFSLKCEFAELRIAQVRISGRKFSWARCSQLKVYRGRRIWKRSFLSVQLYLRETKEHCNFIQICKFLENFEVLYYIWPKWIEISNYKYFRWIVVYIPCDWRGFTNFYSFFLISDEYSKFLAWRPQNFQQSIILTQPSLLLKTFDWSINSIVLTSCEVYFRYLLFTLICHFIYLFIRECFKIIRKTTQKFAFDSFAKFDFMIFQTNISAFWWVSPVSERSDNLHFELLSQWKCLHRRI